MLEKMKDFIKRFHYCKVSSALFPSSLPQKRRILRSSQKVTRDVFFLQQYVKFSLQESCENGLVFFVCRLPRVLPKYAWNKNSKKAYAFVSSRGVLLE